MLQFHTVQLYPYLHLVPTIVQSWPKIGGTVTVAKLLLCITLFGQDCKINFFQRSNQFFIIRQTDDVLFVFMSKFFCFSNLQFSKVQTTVCILEIMDQAFIWTQTHTKLRFRFLFVRKNSESNNLFSLFFFKKLFHIQLVHTILR